MRVFLLALIILLVWISLEAQEQPQNQDVILFNPSMFVSSNSERGIPFRTQEQIDSMQMVAQGYMVFNTTSGCLNYYFGKSWFQLCGECIPKPQIPKIDSIFSKGSRIFIYFQKTKMDSLETFLGKKRYVSVESPLVMYVREQVTSPAQIQMIVHNSCGKKDTTLQIQIEGMQSLFSPILTEEMDGKKIRYRKYGDCKWMVEDYILDKPAIPKSPYWVSMENNKNPCPKGWSIPKEKDWLKLLSNFEGNYSALFEKPTDENLSIGLNKNGIYLVSEKNIVAPGTASYYVGETKGKNQKLINITDNGYLVPDEDPKLFMLPLRCVQCEK